MKKDSYDYIIIGAGISGLSAAYHLAKDGFSVCVLEATDGKNSASYASTAEMNHDPDADWENVIQHFGAPDTGELWRLFGDTLDTMNEFAHQVGEEHFRTDRVPAYFYSYTPEGASELEKRFSFYTQIAANVTLDREPRPDLHPSFTAVLTTHGDGVTNNQHLLSSLTKGILQYGGEVLYNTEVTALGDTIVQTKDGGSYVGEHIIIANGDGGGLTPAEFEIHKKITFVLSLEKNDIPELYKNAVMWDTDEPYHYVRAFAGNRIWIGGGDERVEEYTPSPENDEEKYRELTVYADTVLGISEGYTRQAAWSGVFFPAKRGLPYITPIAGTNRIASVGFGGSGVVTSFLSGYLIAAWRRGDMTQYAKFFAGDWK